MIHRLGLVIALLLVGPRCWAGYWYNATFVTFGATSQKLGGKFIVQGVPPATDGYDADQFLDTPLDPLLFPKPLYVATYKTNGADGWNAADGWYRGDSRPPLPAWQTVTEDIYLWVAPSTPAEGILLSWDAYCPTQVTCALRLVSTPNGVTYSGPTLWGPAGGYVGPFPYYSTTDGRTGYHFQALLTAVPEPSSVLALICGLGGVGGLGGLTLRRARER